MRFYPEGATPRADAHSDAIAYLYTNDLGHICATYFSGKRNKPDGRYRYPSEQARDDAIQKHFEQCRAVEAARAKRKAEQVAANKRALEVGHILVSSWGYEQTNVNYYQVTALVGDSMVEIRPIGAIVAETHTSMSGKVLPKADAFKGDPMRKKARGASVRISSYQIASLWDGTPDFTSSWN